MCKINFKFLWTYLLLSMSLVVSAQEICNNAIDDDADGLIDLNDDDCSCSDIAPLTSISGSLCDNDLRMTFSVMGATAFQWYKDGIAIIGQTNSLITLSDFIPDVEGSYEVVATTATGCVISEAQEILIPSFETDLGIETICAGDTIIFGPFFLTTPGDFSFTTPAFQEGASGCDSIVRLEVRVAQDERFLEFDTACEGTEYIFGTQILTQSGTYEEEFDSFSGCDSVVRLTINFELLDPIVLVESICKGDTFTFRNIEETESGVYETSFLGAEGCDTTYMIELNVIEPVESDRAEDICSGGQIEIDGTIFDTAGDFVLPYTAISGCDSLVNLTISELAPDTFRFDRQICQGLTFEYGDISVTTAGEYMTLIETPDVCDSLVVITLEIIEPMPEVEAALFCEGGSFEWRGEIYSEPGSYEDEVTMSGGCDVLYRLELEEIEPVVTTIDDNICAGGSIEIGGTTYDTEGTFEVELTSVVTGCDSTVVITISEDEPEVFEFQERICRGEIFVYNDIEATTEGTYETVVNTPGVCDSMIVVVLSVDEPMPMVESQSICQGLSIEWNGMTIDTEGRFEFEVANPGECVELFVLDLAVTEPEVISEAMELCPDELPFKFEDLEIDSTGIFTTTVSTPNECDVTYEFDIEVLESSASAMQDRILCPGDSFDFFGQEINTAGSYMAEIANAVGCDSTITLQVLASAVQNTTENAQICPDETLVWNGMILTDEGSYDFTSPNQFGCDSTVTLTLEFSSSLVFDMAFEICQGETFVDYGLSETESGNYSVFLDSGVGCDSTINIALTVNDTTMSFMPQTICAGETYELHSISATESGTYQTLVPGGNTTGCDSTVFVELTVISHDETEVPVEICEGETFEFGGIILDDSGRYIDTLSSFEGCDSIVSLLLEVTPLGRSTEELLICPGDEFDFNGTLITEAGTYEARVANAVGCDSLITVVVEIDDPAGLLILPEDQVINIGSEIDLVPEFISPSLTGFEWSDEDGNVIGQESELFAFAPVEDTWVELFATNEFGCEVRERVRIDVELIIDIYLPNVITPNIDDPNRYFTIGANESVIGIKELFIYDRWGELMFTDSHEGNLDTYLGWDGTFNNQTVIQGVYAYFVVFDIIDGSEVLRKGSLTVLD